VSASTTHPPIDLNLTLTPSALAACHRFADEHGVAIDAAAIAESVGESLAGLLALIADERWLLCADVHRFHALAINHQLAPTLTLHARHNDDESWTVGTPEEFPVSAEYERRRHESGLAILRRLEQEIEA
jgi:hypothetical protein